MRDGRDVLLVGRARETEIHLLENEGLDAAAADSILEAIARLVKSPCRVVVLSASEIAGRESDALDALRKTTASPHVLLTLPPRPDDGHARDTEALADDAMDEPYAAEDLVARVRRLVARARRRRNGTATFPVGARLPARELVDLLEEVSLLHGNSVRLERLAEIALDIFAERTGATRLSLLLLDRKRRSLTLKAARGLPGDVPSDLRVPIGQGIAGRIARDRRPLVIEDVGSMAEDLKPGPGSYRTRSFASFPLLAGRRLVGVVNLADRADGSCFSGTSLPALALLAGEAGRAFQNALRLRRMTRLSVIDAGSGLYNRRFLVRSLAREFRRAVRYERPLTLAVIDIDNFKVYNDENGHEAGNRALTRIGRLLKASFRDTDTVARYGGDEFAVILPELAKGEDDSSGALAVLERLRRRIRAHRFPGEGTQPGGTLSISSGAASYPGDAESPRELLVEADRAMYLAKRTGRDRVC